MEPGKAAPLGDSWEGLLFSAAAVAMVMVGMTNTKHWCLHQGDFQLWALNLAGWLG